MAILRPDLMMKNVVPVIMWVRCLACGLWSDPFLRLSRAGIIAIYGLVVSVLISGDRECTALRKVLLVLVDATLTLRIMRVVVKSPMPLYTGFIQLGAGLSVGLAGLAAGFAIGEQRRFWSVDVADVRLVRHCR